MSSHHTLAVGFLRKKNSRKQISKFLDAFDYLTVFESKINEMANSEKDAVVNELYQNITGKNISAIDSRAFRPSDDVGIDFTDGG